MMNGNGKSMGMSMMKEMRCAMGKEMLEMGMGAKNGSHNGGRKGKKMMKGKKMGY